MIVTAGKLNKRSSPVTDVSDKSNVVDIVRKGTKFESQAEVTNVLGKWYQDKKGHFYWEGGVKELKTNYQQLFSNIPTQWMQTNGRNIKIAVLDTGFFLDHADLAHLKPTVIVQDFGQNNNTKDNRGHGTHILGLLGARSSAPDGVNGLIPDAQFFLYKVVMDNVGFLDVFAEAAVLDAIHQKVDVISMSFNVPSKENSTFHEAIKKAIAANILVVASAGENDKLIQNSLVFPSEFEGVVSVGEADALFGQSLTKPFNDQLDLIMPLVDQRSCWINDSFGMYKELKGSSMATALVSGLLASSMSFTNKALDPLNELKNISPQFSNSIFNDLKLQTIKPWIL
jgi:subtilisin family serine protease